MYNITGIKNLPTSYWFPSFKQIILLAFISMISACSTSPQPLEFGKDLCAFCQMTAMDKKFGAELINKQGKALKFDSEECMLNYLNSNKEFKAITYLVVNYENPGELIDAQKAFYLQGGNVKSPMGGKLAAFKTPDAAKKFQAELKGDVLLWDKISVLKF
jgi:copper chaperone NosL